jgi:hypothetical protein
MINIKKNSGFLVWVLLMVSCATLSCAKELPKLKLATLQYNLGNLDPDHRVQTIFADFTNQGGGELVITDVKTDCDCTTVQYPKGAYTRHLGDKIKIKVDLTPFFPGPILKKVAIYVNDQPNPVVITIKGNLIGRSN